MRDRGDFKASEIHSHRASNRDGLLLLAAAVSFVGLLFTPLLLFPAGPAWITSVFGAAGLIVVNWLQRRSLRHPSNSTAKDQDIHRDEIRR